MELNIKEKVPKFLCEKCNYSTERKSQYERHLLTAKHKNTYNTYKNTDKKVPKVPNHFRVYVE